MGLLIQIGNPARAGVGSSGPLGVDEGRGFDEWDDGETTTLPRGTTLILDAKKPGHVRVGGRRQLQLLARHLPTYD